MYIVSKRRFGVQNSAATWAKLQRNRISIYFKSFRGTIKLFLKYFIQWIWRHSLGAYLCLSQCAIITCCIENEVKARRRDLIKGRDRLNVCTAKCLHWKYHRVPNSKSIQMVMGLGRREKKNFSHIIHRLLIFFFRFLFVPSYSVCLQYIVRGWVYVYVSVCVPMQAHRFHSVFIFHFGR